jgi:hypothetical protein
MLVLAILVGFAFVHLFLRPAHEGSSRDRATEPAVTALAPGQGVGCLG